MKISRSIALIAGVSSVVIIALGVRHLADLAGPPPVTYSRGEVLNVASLKAGERIEIAKVVYPDRGETIARRYTITGGDLRRFDAVELSTSWPKGKLETKVDHAICSFFLSSTQDAGLDSVFTYYRQHEAELSTSRHEYHFTYFRNEQVIGEGLVIGYFFIDQLTYIYWEKMRGEFDADFDYYGDVAKNLGWSKESVKRMVTLEMLEAAGRAEKI